jgi:hypothetical protein
MPVSADELAHLVGKILKQDSSPYTRMFVNSLTYADSELTHIGARFVEGGDEHPHLSETLIEHAKANIFPNYSISVKTENDWAFLGSEEVADFGNGNGKTEWEDGWSIEYNCPMWTNRATGEVEYDDVADETDEIEDVTDETRSPFGDDATLGGVWHIQQGNDPIALKPLLRRGKRERRAPANFQGADVLGELLDGLLQKDVSYITLHYITFPPPPGIQMSSPNFECYSKCHFLLRGIDRIIRLM